jgi:hypothetical protein
LCSMLVSSLALSLKLKMEMICSSKTSDDFHQTTWCNIQDIWPPQIQHTSVCWLVLLMMTDHCIWHLTQNGKTMMTVLSQHLMEGVRYFQKKKWGNWNLDQYLNPWPPEYESSANHYASALRTRKEVIFYFRLLSQS